LLADTFGRVPDEPFVTCEPLTMQPASAKPIESQATCRTERRTDIRPPQPNH
jgi:hypothetical protein